MNAYIISHCSRTTINSNCIYIFLIDDDACYKIDEKNNVPFCRMLELLYLYAVQNNSTALGFNFHDCLNTHTHIYIKISNV